MKKNITLISLMLGVMVLMSAIGIVSADTWPYLYIDDIDLNGENQVIVAPSQIIDVDVDTSVECSSCWKSTGYIIEGQTLICVNHENHCSDATESFDITAPSSEGEYDFTVKVYQSENCNWWEGDHEVLWDGIIVVEPDTTDPVIGDITVDPEYPDCTSNVEVCATVTDNIEVDFVNITCSADGTSVTKYDVAASGNQYCATFSASTMGPSDGDGLTCTIYAEDTSDNEDQSGPTVLATYDCANPVAEFHCSPLSGDEDLAVSCYSDATDTVDSDLDHYWTFGNGQTSTDEDPSVTYTEDGLYTVSLTVTDDAGHSDTETKIEYIDVLDIGPETSFTESVHEFGESQSVDFTDTSTSHDPILSRLWDFGDGQTSTEQNPLHTYADDGTYTVTLTICDEDNDCDSATDTKIVTNEAPDVNAGEYTCNEGETISLNAATASDVAADYPLTFEWDLDGDDVYETPGQVVSYICGNGDAILTDVVALKVTDKDGGWNVDEAEITINNVPPVANANGPYVTAVGENVCFAGSATDVVDTAFNYEWDTDYDGSTFNVDLTGENPCTTYSETGTYTIALIANDGDDDSEVVTTTITVYDYAIELNTGWNLISIPLVPEDTSIDAVFASIYDKIADDGAVVLQYDAVNGNWKMAMKDGIGGFAQVSSSDELTNVVSGYGYWIKIAELEESEEAILYLNGEKTAEFGLPPSVTLAMDSWNLIGVYGLDNPVVNDALVSLEDEENNKYYDIIYGGEEGIAVNSGDNLESKEGYWISIKKAFAGSETIQYKANYGSTSE